jgi:RNA polymerase sigma factor (sigma-70 family)
VLLQGWQARGQLRDQNRLAGWLMAIATRMALTAAQARQQRRGRWLALDETGLAGSAPGTAESVEFAEEVQAAWAALATLAPRQRAAFVLCSVEGCTVAQAAACLGITAGAVKRHLSRARNQLRRRLAPYWNEEEDA